jgi:hypothetical protein
MKIKYPVSFGILMATLVLTSFLTVALHSLLAWLGLLNLGLIASLRFVSHSETTDGVVARFTEWLTDH